MVDRGGGRAFSGILPSSHHGLEFEGGIVDVRMSVDRMGVKMALRPFVTGVSGRAAIRSGDVSK